MITYQMKDPIRCRYHSPEKQNKNNKQQLNRYLLMNHKTQQNDDIQAIMHLGVTRCAFIFCCLVRVLVMIRIRETRYDVHTRRQESHHEGEMNDPQNFPRPQCFPMHPSPLPELQRRAALCTRRFWATYGSRK